MRRGPPCKPPANPPQNHGDLEFQEFHSNNGSLMVSPSIQKGVPMFGPLESQRLNLYVEPQNGSALSRHARVFLMAGSALGVSRPCTAFENGVVEILQLLDAPLKPAKRSGEVQGSPETLMGVLLQCLCSLRKRRDGERAIVLSATWQTQTRPQMTPNKAYKGRHVFVN